MRNGYNRCGYGKIFGNRRFRKIRFLFDLEEDLDGNYEISDENLEESDTIRFLFEEVYDTTFWKGLIWI